MTAPRGAGSFACAALCSLSIASAAVRLVPNLSSPQPVGTVIGLTAFLVPDASAPPGPPMNPFGPSPLVARYAVSVDGGDFHIVRDFSQDLTFHWRPELYEHEARVRVTVRNNQTKKTLDAELPFSVTSRVSGSQAVAIPTANPLVALFSAPPCPEGSKFRAVFQRKGDSQSSRTSLDLCRGSRSSNVYVAGMRADSEYDLQVEVVTGDSVQPGPSASFHTGILDGNFPPVSFPLPRDSASTSPEGLMLFSLLEPWHPMATDLDGHVVWYLTQPDGFLTRMLPGGRFLLQSAGANASNSTRRLQLIREVDLASNTLRETNISRIAEQMAERGIKSVCEEGSEQCIPGFHHEAIRLPNGHTLVVASLERMFPAGTQGAKERVDILGDLILDLDQDFQLSWFWNAFDHLDLKRRALSPEAKCRGGAGDDGCPPVLIAPSANDWLHSNSLNYNPKDGSLMLSVCEQDWVVKIDYRDGKGSGKILWRLGKDGDFTVKSSDPYPWFSYQHDVGFDPPGSDTISLLDDGHERKKKDPKGNNRAQVWRIDEGARTATLLVNADLGVYSMAVGAAQRLKNGDIHGLSGLIPGPMMTSRSTEISPDGKVVYALQMDGALAYRTFRIADMYSPPAK